MSRIFLIVLSLVPFMASAQVTDTNTKEIKFVVSGNEAFTMKVYGFGQARLTALEKANGTSTQSYDLPLVRLGFKGTAYTPDLTYNLTFQASSLPDSNDESRLLDGWMKFKHCDLMNIKVGRMLLAYSRQFYAHPGELLFQDISLADEIFALPRSTGVEFSGHAGKVGYNLASVNSVRSLGEPGQQNRANHLAWIGRVEFDVLGAHDYVESGVTAKDAPVLSVGAAAGFNPIADGTAAQNSKDGDDSTQYTADFGGRWWNFNLQGAYYARKTESTGASGTAGEAADDKGYFVQGGWYAMPKLEAVARTGKVDYDFAHNAGTVGDVKETSIGANYYFQGHSLKLQGDYSWLETSAFAGGSSEDRRLRVQAQFLF